MPDIYDFEIKRIRGSKDPLWEVYHSWDNYGPLFTRVSAGCGCLTQVKYDGRSCDYRFRDKIMTDARIPQKPVCLGDNRYVERNQAVLDALEVFAEYQREINLVLNR